MKDKDLINGYLIDLEKHREREQELLLEIENYKSQVIELKRIILDINGDCEELSGLVDKHVEKCLRVVSSARKIEKISVRIRKTYHGY